MKSAAVLVASPRVFPLSVHAIFTRKIQIFTHKFTPLSKCLPTGPAEWMGDAKYKAHKEELNQVEPKSPKHPFPKWMTLWLSYPLYSKT